MVEHLRAVDVREHRFLGEPARAVEDLERLADLAQVHASPGLDENGAELELRSGKGREHGRELLDLGDRVLVLARLDRRLGARDDALHPLALARRDADLEEGRIDAEPRGQPFDRLRRRAGLAPLDLAHVLLGEAGAGEVGLGQPAGDAEPTDPLAQRRAVGRSDARECRRISHLSPRVNYTS